MDNVQIPINFKVPPPDRLRVCRQARKIYEILKFRSKFDCFMTNDEMSKIARKYTGRVSEIREALKPYGQTIKCVKKEKSGLCYYAIMEREEQ